jgi:hypothetical protein
MGKELEGNGKTMGQNKAQTWIFSAKTESNNGKTMRKQCDRTCNIKTTWENNGKIMGTQWERTWQR